ncbi:hypothetical protein [Sodalis sp.]
MYDRSVDAQYRLSESADENTEAVVLEDPAQLWLIFLLITQALWVGFIA